MRPIQPATLRDRQNVTRACELLREARDLLKAAKAPRAAAKAQRALKSAEGAERHACHRLRRTDDSVRVLAA